MGEVYIVASKKLHHRNADFNSKHHYDYIIDSFDLRGVWNLKKQARTFQKKGNYYVIKEVYILDSMNQLNRSMQSTK